MYISIFSTYFSEEDAYEEMVTAELVTQTILHAFS